MANDKIVPSELAEESSLQSKEKMQVQAITKNKES